MVNLKRVWHLHRRIRENSTAVVDYVTRGMNDGLSKPRPWPSVVYIGINNQCNYFCNFCDIGKANLERKRIPSDFVYNLWTEETASFKTWKSLIEDVSRFKPIIAVTTTEPSLYPQLFELINYVHSKGMEIWVTTNGFLLPFQAPEFLRTRLDRLQVSIDGPPQIHDRIRGVKGGFKRAMDGVEYIMKNRMGEKPYVSLNYVVCDMNYDCLVETLGFVKCDEIIFSHLNFVTEEMASMQNTKTPFRATPTSVSSARLDAIDIDILHDQCNRLRGLDGDLRIHITPDLDREGLEIHYRQHLKPHDYIRTCHAMTDVGQIMADGSVTVSTRCLSTIRFGKITEKPFTEIWRGKNFEDFREYMQKVKLMPACLRCCGAL